jgi:hypothetical protein
MGVVYCLGIPLGSFFALRAIKGEIKRVQKMEQLIIHHTSVRKSSTTSVRVKDLQERLESTKVKRGSSLLLGLAPLYKDYEPEQWWFEIVQLEATLFLCGVTTFLPAESASQVAASLIVSLLLFGAFANWRPYLNMEDDILAQTCQFSITMVFIVGLLQMIGDSEQGGDDKFFGNILIFLTTLSVVAGFGLISLEFVQVMYPEALTNAISKFLPRSSKLAPLQRSDTAGVRLRKTTTSLPNDANPGGPDGPPTQVVRIKPAEATAISGPPSGRLSAPMNTGRKNELRKPSPTVSKVDEIATSSVKQSSLLFDDEDFD